MNNKRKSNISKHFGNIRNVKSFSYFSNNKNKSNKISLLKPKTDYKNIFKNYYKSKNKEKEYNSLKNSFNDINKNYLKCQNTIQDYFLKDSNQFGLKIEGNKSLENYSLDEISIFINKTCSRRESFLRKKILNYYYPKDNKNKLMGKEMTLTPIPYKKNIFMKNKVEKEDYLNAKKAAVFMRRLEYTHGFKKYQNKKLIRDKTDLFSVIKGAVKIIEDWWIRIINKRRKFEMEKEKELFHTLSFTERETYNSEKRNTFRNMENKNSELSKSNLNNSLIDKWITSQIKDLIKNNNKKTSTHDNKRSLIFLSKSKNINKQQIDKNKTNNVTLFKSNKKKKESKNANKKYNNIFERNQRNSLKQQSIKSVENPIKILQNYDIFSSDRISKEDTTITPSDYLQNYFEKDFAKSNKNSSNKSSKQNLQTFELIRNKYRNNNFKNDNEGIYSINSIDNLATQEEMVNQNINSIERTINLNISSEPKERRNINLKIIEKKKIENNVTSMSNKSKNLSSDIEPIKQDEKINLEINKAYIGKNMNKKKKNYEIRYSIIKNQNLNKNKYSDKSSMDGSVDEIITKKLQDFYKRDKKYSQRINKAFNQVKEYKYFSVDRKNNFNFQNIQRGKQFKFDDDEY